jgi:hypothetical protein
MGDITDTFRRLFGSKQKVNQTLVQIPTACLPAKGNKKVSIKIFGDGNLFGQVFSTAGEETSFRQGLETFFDDMDKTPNIDPVAVQLLQAFSFEVTFIKRDSTSAERAAFGMMDFPMYLRTTAAGSEQLTQSEGKKLLEAHKIPKKTIVMKLSDGDDLAPAIEDFDPFAEVAAFIPDPTLFGVGIPGPYADVPSQLKCRKMGIIKVNDLVQGVASFTDRQTRFLFVLKHELGHMFGLAHLENTLMARKLKDIATHPNFTKGQIFSISTGLAALSP